jgi:ABC-type nitrate/sulfonate/bicarbonate transport system ATPase subunit
MIEASNVSYSYPTGTAAVRNVSFSVPTGKTVGIVGPSGCGKSTMLALMAGFMRPTSGLVSFASDVDRSRPRLAMVFQKDTLLPWATVRKNVGFYFTLNPTKSKEAEAQRIDELLAMVGLEKFGNLYPYQLSGGMRRRVAFLVGVVARPHALFLDEPFSSVDEPSRISIHQDVLKIVREFNMTVVIVTHDLAEALTLSDAIVMMTRGPGTVLRTWDVPFGRERDAVHLRETPAFLDLYRTLWHELTNELNKRKA